MMKRIIVSLLMLVIVVTTMSIFVSCKDYDDDINDLRNQISQNSSDLTSLVNDKINTVDSEISSLQSQLSSLESAYKAADENLQKAINDALENANKYADDSAAAAEQGAKDYADIQAAQAQEAAISAAKELIEEAVSGLQTQLDAANQIIAEQGNSIVALVEADALLQVGIDEAKALAGAAQEAAETAQAAVNDLQDQIDALEQVDDKLQSSISNLESQISVLNEQVEEVISQAAENKANIEKVYNYLKGLSEANEEAINVLSGKYDDLEKLVKENQESIEKELSDAVEELDGEITSALAEAKAYAYAIAYQAANELYENLLKGEFADINTSIGTLQIAIEDVEKAYQKAIGEVYDYVDNVNLILQNRIDSINAKIDQVKISIEDLGVEGVKERVSVLESEVEGIQTAIKILQGTTGTLEEKITDLESKVSIQASQIENITEELGQINKYLGVLGKRLTSLVFAPTTYVDGVEAITFSTLTYTTWTDLTADEPGGEKYTINNDMNIEEYLVSPSHLDINSIASLSYVCTYATSYSTRAVTDEAPIKVASYVYDKNEDGVKTLQLKLEKNDSNDDFSTISNNFPIVALKATIDSKYLLQSEIDAGEEVAVYSDWARLYEVHATPYIHNTQSVDENGTPIEEGTGSETESNPFKGHFFSYSTTHTNNAGRPNSGTEEYPISYGHAAYWIVDDFAYNSTYDLSQLVMVCDKNGHTYDAATYGLEFRFELMEYWCYHNANDHAEQSAYFGIQDDGSTLYVLPNVTDGDVASRLAIGKYAPIRVTLVDTNNVDASSGNPAVVDVRYFFIECKDASAFYDMGDLLNDTTEWTGCGEEYSITITADEIGAKCGVVDPETGVDMPITYEELIDNYKLLTYLWASHEDAKTVGTKDANGNSTEASPDDDLGTIALDSDDNIVWTVTPEITQEDYDLGQKVIEAWGVYQSKTLDSNIIPFKLTLTITLQKMTRIANHNEPYWVVTSGTNTHSGNDTDSVRIFNPALETDATYGDSKYQTTQMIGDLLVGYIMNGTIPSTWKSTISSCDGAHVAFDDTYLEALREAINETYGFKEGDTDYIGEDDLAITNSGHTLTLKGVAVAEYVADENSGSLHYIRLIETDSGSATSVPASGAELLVGQFIPLKYYGTTCSWNEVMDQWFVYFMEPLTMEKGKVINIDLYDVTAGGSTSGDQLDGTIELWEEFTTNKRLVWDNADPTKVTDTSLAAWYGVNDPEYDVDNAVTNLTLSGGVGTTFDNKLSAFKKDDGITNMYNLIYDKENNQFVYSNNSDSSIGTAFEVIVPVILQTKWQTFTAMQVHITIHPSW